ncbi:MAG: GNAT family N-acetyltransferase [Gemmatimonadetes bacterium]|nr:GNAT family N-acetyltransferase [Gemmatimonadota bacterium]
MRRSVSTDYQARTLSADCIAPISLGFIGAMPPSLKSHTVHLRTSRLRLRPMTDADWDILLRWNQDPDVLYYADGADVTAYTLDQIKRIYGGISQAAFCFIAELDGQPIAEAWLQAMNLSRIIEAYPGCDCRRIDLSIGEKQYWNKGLGTEIIRALVDFGFSEEKAELIFACDIADYNPRSRAAFAKVGFQVVAHIAQPPGGKAHSICDMRIAQTEWAASTNSSEDTDLCA